MKIAITGGTGFVGRHLAQELLARGHEVVLLARGVDTGADFLLKSASIKFVASDLSDTKALTGAFEGCDAVAHCAGINRERGAQTYQRVHVEATENVVTAARAAGVKKIAVVSFLRARPDCGSPYHESKWKAEEIVRSSGLDYTILKCGVIYGRGDHMLDHLSHALFTFPIFATVGFRSKSIRPMAVEDLVQVLYAAIVDNRLSRQTVAVTGPEELYLVEAVKRVARVTGRRALMFPAPVWFHYLLGWFLERTMKIPLVSLAQVRILTEGVVQAEPPCELLPDDLKPATRFTDEQIRNGLPKPGPFTLGELLFSA